MVYSIENLNTNETAINELKHVCESDKDIKEFLEAVNGTISKDCDHAFNCGMIDGAILIVAGMAAYWSIRTIVKTIKDSKETKTKE